jgi:hypothetical protein
MVRAYQAISQRPFFKIVLVDDPLKLVVEHFSTTCSFSFSYLLLSTIILPHCRLSYHSSEYTHLARSPSRFRFSLSSSLHARKHRPSSPKHSSLLLFSLLSRTSKMKRILRENATKTVDEKQPKNPKTVYHLHYRRSA